MGKRQETDQTYFESRNYTSLHLETAEHLYVGQTIDLTLRYQEHRDGAHPTTKGTNPRLVYYEEIDGNRTEANEREDELTLMALEGHGRRRIRDLIEEFRTHLRLVDFEA
jgi:predicted GIY-YIG superfamily endonuclease